MEDKNEDEEESDEESSSDEAQIDSVSGGPTIELKVALGSLDENPAIAMLAGDSDDGDSDRQEKEKQEGNTNNDKKVSTLREAGVSGEAPNAERDGKTKKRKVLIEELS